MAADRCDLLCLDLPRAEELRAALPGPEVLETLAATAKTLSDPTRLAIALSLHRGGESCVCDLAWIIGRDERLVSHHLRLLKAAGAATSRRSGRMVLYTLMPAAADLLTTLTTEAAA